MMKLIISGGRNYSNYAYFRIKVFEIERHFMYLEIVSGGCHGGVHTFTRPDGTKVYGVDGMAERYAEEQHRPMKIFEAEWSKYGRSAGPIRNKEMAKYGNGLISFWDGKSKGTKNMIDLAYNHKLNPIEVINI